MDLQRDVEKTQREAVNLLNVGLLDHSPYRHLSHWVESGLQTLHGVLGSAASSIRAKKDGKRRIRDSFFERGDAMRAKKDVLFSNASRFLSSRGGACTVRNLQQWRAMRAHLQHVRKLASEQETFADVVLISGCKDAQLSEEAGLRGETRRFGVLTRMFLETLGALFFYSRTVLLWCLISLQTKHLLMAFRTWS